MKKLSLKDLVDFRRKSDKAKKTFVENIKSPKIVAPEEGGGDYWICGVSAICKSYQYEDAEIIEEKIAELQEKIDSTKHTISKNMYRQNIAIMNNYGRLQQEKIRPAGKVNFLKKSTGNPLLTVKGLDIQVKPGRIFTFGKKDEESVGAIWFIAKKEGYRNDDLGMHCEMLFKFLKNGYSKEYELSSKYCLVVDLLASKTVSYLDIEAGTVPPVLNSTLEEINKLM